MFNKFIHKNCLIVVLTCFFCCTFQLAYTKPATEPETTQIAEQKSYVEGIESSPIILSNHAPVAKGEFNPLNGSIYELLDKAEASILIYSFTFGDFKTAKIINEKAEKGVKIKLVLDRAHVGTLRSQLHPSIEIVTRATGEGHVHHKMLIIDEMYVWIGSPNFSSEGILTAKNISIAYYDPTTASALHHEALCIEGKAQREDTSPLTTYFDDQCVELYLLPHTEHVASATAEWELNVIALTKLINLINQATTSIKVAMNVWTYKDLSRALANAKLRGVDVQVITIKSNQLQESVQILRAAGIPVKYVESHYKWMLVDDLIYMNGSPNWSMNAFSRSDESFLVIHNVTEKQLNTVYAIWNNLSR